MATYGYLNSSPSHYNQHQQHPQEMPRKGCCGLSSQFMRYVLFIFNFLFFSCGLFILLVTIFYRSPHLNLGNTSTVPIIRSLLPMTHPLNLVHYAMLFIGCLICIVSIVNIVVSCCCSSEEKEEDQEMDTVNEDSDEAGMSLSSSRERNQRHDKSKTTSSSPTFFLCFFIFTLLFLFTLQLSTGFVAFISVSPSESTIEPLASQNYSSASAEYQFLTSVRENLNASATNGDILRAYESDFDTIQTEYKCCGLVDYVDFKTTFNRADPVPDSCCKTAIAGCGQRIHPSNIYYKGCLHRLQSTAKEQILLLGSVALGLSIVEVFGLIFSCCLYVQLLSSSRK